MGEEELTCPGVLKAVVLNEACTVAEKDAITERTEAGIYSDWGKEGLERVTLNVARFSEQG